MLPKSPMIQYFTNSITTRINKAGIDFIFAFVPMESSWTCTGEVFEVNTLTGGTIKTGVFLTSITFSHYLRVRWPYNDVKI